MKFLNRVVEAEEISRLVLSDVSNNKIILVYGTTGVGKSGLVQKLLEDELSSQASIKVKVSKSSIDTIENLQYLNSIYRAVCAAGKIASSTVTAK
jgi:predicted AAA+ superfamily ATPase